MASQTLFFRILPAPKNTLFCLCFGAPRIFSKTRFLTLAPFLGSPSGRFFPDFRPNGVFQISARSENTPILPVIWCLSNFFQITIFDFSPIFGLAVGPFCPRFSAKRCFSDFRPVRKYPDFACDLVSFPFFFKSRFSTLAPFLGSPSGRFFPDFRPNGVFQISARSENTPMLPVIWCLSHFFQITIFDFSFPLAFLWLSFGFPLAFL